MKIKVHPPQGKIICRADKLLCTEEGKLIEPLHDRLLVRRLPEREETILLTDREKNQLCRVLAIGPGRWHDGVFCKTAVKPGDTVLLPGWGGQHPDREFEDGSFLVQEGDVGAIVG